MIHAAVHRNSVDSKIEEIKISITSESIANFCTLLSRGTNCWDNAPTEIRELADMAIHGRVLQDYSRYNQSINTNQNTDMYTVPEQNAITAWKEKHTLEEWMELVNTNSIHKVFRESSI
jgi:hypothetical protein